jgi:acetoin utilization deacetylase AcuC-like enzyme
MDPIRIYYSDAYCHQGASFDTHAKAQLVADRIRSDKNVAMVAPDPASSDELRLVHDRNYVDAILTGTPAGLAESNGFEWNAHLRDGVLATTGGVRDAALYALQNKVISGSLSSGLHHAARSRGRGFCTVNGLALGAVAARRAGAHRVLILDVDAHCGGGTADIIDGQPGIEQLDLSVNAFDHYENTDNARLVMTDGPSYIVDLTQLLFDVQNPDGIDLVLYNAGMDPHEGAGGVSGVTTDVIVKREQFVMDWCRHHGIPVAFVLAGGYSGTARTMGEVADLHVHTLRAAAQTGQLINDL